MTDKELVEVGLANQREQMLIELFVQAMDDTAGSDHVMELYGVEAGIKFGEKNKEDRIMSMLDWAKREVEIAVARERTADGTKEGEFSYGGACYESALKAFESLMEDGHSGFSIMLTKNILNRLIDGKPLTPIEDTDEEWEEIFVSSSREEGKKEYQCKRMSSLFKTVNADGSVEYSDVNRIVCEDKHDPDNTYFNGFVRGIIEKMFPIAMPYCPGSKPIRVICEELLTDEKNGDYDGLGIIYILKPSADGRGTDSILINRYFKENGRGWDEIGYDEWAKRREMDKARQERLEAARKGEKHD